MSVGTDRSQWAIRIANGEPAVRIAREAGVSRHTVAREVGGVERPRRKRRSIWVVPDWYERVAEIAKRFGLVNDHSEAVGEGSPGKLLDEIGAGRCEVICPGR